MLGDLLREIERQTAVRFEVADSTYGRLVSERFSDVPMVQGIQRLLTGQDYLIDHAPPQLAHESASMLVRVLGESSGASRITQHAPTTAEDADEAAWRRAQQLSDLAAVC